MPPETQKSPKTKRHRLEKKKEKLKERRTKETPEQRRARLDQVYMRTHKKELEEMSEAERQIHVQNRKRLKTGDLPVKKRYYDPEKGKFNRLMKKMAETEEEKEARKTKSYFYRMARKGKTDRKNLPEAERQRLRDQHTNWVRSLTGEKKRRHEESIARALRKSQKKIYASIKADPERWEQFKESQRARYARETPEQTQRRRNKDRVNLAKGKLRKKLQQENAAPEEIEKQLAELKERMWKEFYPKGDVPPPGKKGKPRKPRAAVVEPRVTVAPKEFSPVRYAEEQTVYNYKEEADVPSPEEEVDAPIPDDEPPPSPDPCWPNTPEPSPPPSPPVDTEERALDLLAVVELVFDCSHCHLTFPSDSHLRSHLLSDHPKMCWKCPKCKGVMLSPLELSHHYASAHKEGSYQQTAEVEGTLKRKPARRSSQWKFLCIKCPAERVSRFESRQKLLAHVKQRHRKNYWPCDGCQLLKYSEEALRLHREMCPMVSGV